MTLPLTSPRDEIVFCSAEYDGATWLFAPMSLFLRPRRFDHAGGEILLGRIAVEIVNGRPASCRDPVFLRYEVAEDGTVLFDRHNRSRAYRSAILMDREAKRNGVIGINRALLRRRLNQSGHWEPSTSARRSFLLQALDMASRPRARVAREDWIAD